ncbi:MAG: Asp-tRNA(Asn)/Glu-tRNA(Gln) amidotransferase subunit GatC [Candidatus Uhrbacteria bacterium]|nr:Asp-tRNA(Asn)/Glu-tRNA(Gln) amidotransferase subunit GatC [Patescibacteria group bacterium]MBU1907096.1 Asp-tRNA(Asn)/Glu-tRNA(Gln) amidotransferase subunit GatC [Patescibacteria group bacterium]
MKIKAEEVKKIAALAKLELSGTEIEQYSDQLSEILKYVDMVNKLDLPPEAPMMAHAFGSLNVMRADIVEGCDTDTRARIIGAFAHREGDLLESPTVFEDRSEDL